MDDRIEIRGLRVRGRHGVYAQEQRDGQTFVVDVILEADLSRPAASDDVGDTVDYAELAGRLAAAVSNTRFDLLEALAGHLADLVLDTTAGAAVRVRVAKPEAPMEVDVDEVAVVVSRRRDR